MDPVHFTGKEVLDMAVRIEENGMRFYADASKAAKSHQLKDLFHALSEEEGTHIKMFLELKKVLVGDDPSTGFDPYLEDAQQYLKSMADTEVFTNPEAGKEAARSLKDEKEAISMAIGMEKDSLLFYYELERMIREKDRAVIESLIEQEKEHVRKLTNLQDLLFGRK
jgi:rubrerythrin